MAQAVEKHIESFTSLTNHSPQKSVKSVQSVAKTPFFATAGMNPITPAGIKPIFQP